jgi:hypothetical protein
MTRYREQNSDRFKAGNWSKVFVKIYPFNPECILEQQDVLYFESPCHVCLICS